MGNYTRGFLREEDLAPSSSITENLLRMVSPLRIANALAPVAHDNEGHYEWALPSAIADPMESWKGMVDRHRAGIQDDEADARDAFSVAGSVGLGSVAATPLKPSNALGAMGRGIANHELPMDLASRMARAKEMGFDVDRPLYHGTQSGDFSSFDLGKHNAEGKAIFTSEDPIQASSYAGRSGSVMPLYAKGNIKESGFQWNGKPIDWNNKDEVNEYLKALEHYNRKLDKNKNTYYNREIADARKEGYDGIVFRQTEDNRNDFGFVYPSDVYAIFDPRNIRSVNAAFDPAKSDSANLLAANPLFSSAIPLAVESNDNERQPLRGGFGPRWETQPQNAFSYQY